MECGITRYRDCNKFWVEETRQDGVLWSEQKWRRGNSVSGGGLVYYGANLAGGATAPLVARRRIRL